MFNLKIVMINITVFLAFIGLLFIGPPLFIKLYKIFTNPDYSKNVDLPNYIDNKWINSYFLEMRLLKRTYHDFISWRTLDFSGSQINVSNGIRKTINSTDPNTKEAWFFGGSTMWGFGVNDQNTIPSHFSQKTGINSINFGEMGYSARQSLAQLQNNYIFSEKNTAKKRQIYFFDGVNDLITHCNKYSNTQSTSQEAFIRFRSDVDKYSYNKTFQQTFEILATLREKIIPLKTEEFDCHIDTNKANLIASRIVKIWENASLLASKNGDVFVAILQPVAFIGKPNLTYLPKNKINAAYKKQFLAVYPLIKKYAENSNIDFLDLTDAYNNCQFCYVDFCHVSHQGNKIIANRLEKYQKTLM